MFFVYQEIQFPFFFYKLMIAVFGFALLVIYRAEHRAGEWFKKDQKREKEKEKIRDSYGAKGWATYDDIKNRLGDPSFGVYIGNNWHWNEKGHVLTVGGAGSGKGVNLIIPTLISDQYTTTESSVVVLDPKGENAAVCAPYLKSRGYEVHVINPFGIREIKHLGNSRWNPLSDIEKGEEKRMCDLIAFSIHNRVSQGEGNFWDNKTRQYISLYLQYDMHLWSGNIVTAYEALMRGGSKRIDHLKAMAENETFSGAQEASNILDSLMGETAKTEENIYMSIYEAMNVFGDKALQESLGAYKPDFEMRTISKKPTAIFLCIRHSDLRYYAAWVRMFTDILLRTLTKHYNPNRKVVVLLDEFAQLGYVNEFKNSPAVLRGYNVTLWPIVQELGQLQSIYGKDWETFISNAAVKHWMGGGMDNTTAKYLEERMPLDIKFVGTNADGSPREVQTKLMTADQIMKMDGFIVEVAGMDKPIGMNKVSYYNRDGLKENASPNPFY